MSADRAAVSRPMFTKVLIANRGEIACRVMRTCRAMGIRTVAVFSEADRNSLHVREADEAVYLGGAAPGESYLDGAKVLAAARQTGAEAIHPGYGFLSENAEFAESCAAAGVVFVGPPAAAIRAMGSKSAAKALMGKAGVPLTPGYHGEAQEPALLAAEAERIGFPVLIKASAGGGGKGMRRVDAAGEFGAALASCQREARASFGDDRVLVERYIERPRHIEIQVFGDTTGRVVSLLERDCSVQRRHQKVVEEAPAPGMTAERRRAMGEAACEAARAVGYTGAGTVEFIADQAGNFFFMEMNTRLQVEHPVTEFITGLDLVAWQLRVAAGEALPEAFGALEPQGHAIEARVYAEDPEREFLPSTGRLAWLRTPEPGAHVRVDAGVAAGDAVTPFYDPMIAKLIVWDRTRELALRRMVGALAAFQVAGVKTNVRFLERLVTSPSFAGAQLDTALIEREAGWLHADAAEVSPRMLALATLAQLLREKAEAGDGSPWSRRDGWRLNGPLERTLRFTGPGGASAVRVTYEDSGYRLQIEEQAFVAEGTMDANGTLRARLDAMVLQATAVRVAGVWHVWCGEASAALQWVDPLAGKASEAAGGGNLLSPMPGLVTALLVAPGEPVEKGRPLLMLEAMKMEYSVVAPAEGTVERFFFAEGEQVAEGVQLLSFKPGQSAVAEPAR